MTPAQPVANRRILVIDDNRAIHRDFQKIFTPNVNDAFLNADAAALFGETAEVSTRREFEIDSAFQGQEGLAMVEKSIAEGRPYAMAFVDVRMPPGWDGVETISHLWKVCPDLQVVICTAYSDYSWDDMKNKLGDSDQLVILKKPFDSIEVLQIAGALVEKWRLHQQTRQHVDELEATVSRRTEELQRKTTLFEALVNSSLDGILVVNERREQLVKNQQFVNLFKIPRDVTDQKGDERQLQFVVNSIKNGERFLDRVEHLYAHPDEKSREEIQFNDGRILDRYSAPVRSPDGTHHGRIWMFRDITAGKQAEERVRESESELRAVFDLASIGIAQADPRTRQWLRVNEKFCSITGYSAEELLKMRVPEITHPDDLEKDGAAFQHVVDGDLPDYRMDKRYIRKDGVIVWVHVNMTVIRDAGGQPVRTIAMVEDITEHIRAQGELKEKLALQERLAKIASNVPGIIYAFRMRPDGSYCLPYVSPTMEEFYGVKPEGLADSAQPVFDLIHPDDQALMRDSMAESARAMSPWHAEFRVRHPRKGLFWVEGQSTPERQSDGSILWHGFMSDITERKGTEEQLHLQTSALTAARNGIVITDRSGRILWINPAFTQLTGYTSGEAIGKTPAILKSGKHDRSFYQNIWDTILNGHAWQGEMINRRKDGSLYHEEMSITPVLDELGHIRNFVAVKHDITGRKRNEEALRAREESFRVLSDNVPDAVARLDRNLRFVYGNRAFACDIKMEPSVFMGKTGKELGLPLAEKWSRELALVFETGQSRSFEFQIPQQKEYSYRESRLVPEFSANGEVEYVLAVTRDVSEQKLEEKKRQEMEVQLRQGQKLEAIGQLAAGIAHEINTPIQYVGDNTRFLKDAFESLSTIMRSHSELLAAAKQNALTPAVLERAGEIFTLSDHDYLVEQVPAAITQSLEGVERVTKIVRAMKEFSHPGGKEKTPADLNKAIESTTTVARNEWKYHAELTLDLAKDLPLVPCFLGEFNQAVLNLVVNASHAIQDAAKLAPSTRGMITISTRHLGDDVEIRVSDTGTGIAEAHRAHIFEPFFTTKDVGRGTGQGLSVIYSSIVKKHGGTVNFETELGKGTTFILRLPVSGKNITTASIGSNPVETGENATLEAAAP